MTAARGTRQVAERIFFFVRLAKKAERPNLNMTKATPVSAAGGAPSARRRRGFFICECAFSSGATFRSTATSTWPRARMRSIRPAKSDQQICSRHPELPRARRYPVEQQRRLPSFGVHPWRQEDRGMMKIALAASVLLVAGIGSASAAALPKSDFSGASASGIVEVQHRDRDRHNRARRPAPPPRWVPGRRYDRSPPGWHRQHRRPGDWRRRGCVTVGPVWFCP